MKLLTLLTALFAVVSAAERAQTSRGLATLASAALPGAGQMMLGNRARGEALMWVDAAIWAVFGGLSWFGSSREQDARLWAARDAGADLSVTDLDYYKALERYDNADEHNEDIRRIARDMFPGDPGRQHEYYLENGYFGFQAWDWTNDSARFGYWETRRSARSATLAAGFAAGGLLLNRAASVIDCAFFAGSRRAGTEARLGFGSGPDLTSIEVRYRF
ncbi:MAG: hypothetical protein JSU73_03505 [candidate division WOR-3 bacterium]|nr:MAG: hypothetical protein JSU73_03505 [candidate division WOR-3 bacterium]